MLYSLAGFREVREKICLCKNAYGLKFYGIHSLGLLKDLAEFCVSKQKEAQVALNHVQSQFENGRNTIAETQKAVKEKNELFAQRKYQTFSDRDISHAYAAGLFDSDGCLNCRTSNESVSLSYTLRVEIAQPSCPGLMEIFARKY